MASNYIFLHSRRSQPIACLFLFPLYLNHLLPRLSIFHVVFLLSLFLPFYMPKYVLTVRCICILSTWPYYRSQKDFINFKTPSPLNMSFTSLFVFILQRFTSPYISLTIFRSNIRNAFGFTAVFVQTSWPVRQRPSDTCTQYYKFSQKYYSDPLTKIYGIYCLVKRIIILQISSTNYAASWYQAINRYVSVLIIRSIPNHEMSYQLQRLVRRKICNFTLHIKLSATDFISNFSTPCI